MQIIDFINGSGYKVSKFPDGEIHLMLEPLNRKEPIGIKCRVTRSDDLFLLMQLSDILHRQCIEVEHIDILCLMGMRCDRLFDLARPFTLSIVAEVINSIGANEVRIFEPHSARALSLIKNSMAVHPLFFLLGELHKRGEYAFVAPDNGAIQRYGHNKFAVVCTKHRDEATGVLTDFSVEATEDISGRNLLVVDDLCDGGGTFVGLAPKLRELNPASLSLFVTHAVQRAGIDRVSAYYDKVYITDTYKDWGAENLSDNVEVFKLNSDD